MTFRFHRKMLTGLAGALALAGSMHALAQAETPIKVIDEIQAEIVRADAQIDQRKLLADAVAAAITDTRNRLEAELVIDIDSSFVNASTTTVARNEVGN